MKSFLIILLMVFNLSIFPLKGPLKPFVTNTEVDRPNNAPETDGLYARIDTNRGPILISLLYREVPLTVTNFIGLAEGTIKNTAKKAGKPFFDGLLFHRVVNNFVIQTGDPKGDGEGGPGYSIPIELNARLKHDSAGTVGMARDTDPDSNGSQFYITHRPTPHLDESYIVFGKVIKGMNTVHQIQQGDHIEKVRIIRVGQEAKGFVANDKCMQSLIQEQKTRNRKRIARQLTLNKKRIEQILKKMDQLPFVVTETDPKRQSRIPYRYTVLKQGSGAIIKEKRTHKARYIGFLEDKSIIADSYAKGVPYLFRLEWESDMLKSELKTALSEMKVGEKRLYIFNPMTEADPASLFPSPSDKKRIIEIELIQ